MKRFLFWTPRALVILFILFLSLFSLDVLGMWGDIRDMILGLLVHNIPGFVLAGVLAVAWRHPIIGAVGYALAGILYVMTIMDGDRGIWTSLSWSLTIAGPMWIIAGLFLAEWRIRERK